MRTVRWFVTTAMWAVALGLLVASASGSAATLALTLPSDQAWTVAICLDAALALVLVADAALAPHGIRVGWGTALRWTAALTTVALNAGAPLAAGDGWAALLHAIPPAGVVIVVETATRYTQVMAAVEANAQRTVPAAAEQTPVPEHRPVPTPKPAPVPNPVVAQQRPERVPTPERPRVPEQTGQPTYEIRSVSSERLPRSASSGSGTKKAELVAFLDRQAELGRVPSSKETAQELVREMVRASGCTDRYARKVLQEWVADNTEQTERPERVRELVAARA